LEVPFGLPEPVKLPSVQSAKRSQFQTLKVYTGWKCLSKDRICKPTGSQFGK